jgi:hypothetical protein
VIHQIIPSLRRIEIKYPMAYDDITKYRRYMNYSRLFLLKRRKYEKIQLGYVSDPAQHRLYAGNPESVWQKHPELDGLKRRSGYESESYR